MILIKKIKLSIILCLTIGTLTILIDLYHIDELYRIIIEFNDNDHTIDKTLNLKESKLLVEKYLINNLNFTKIQFFKSKNNYLEIVPKIDKNYTVSVNWWNHKAAKRDFDDVRIRSILNSMNVLVYQGGFNAYEILKHEYE